MQEIIQFPAQTRLILEELSESLSSGSGFATVLVWSRLGRFHEPVQAAGATDVLHRVLQAELSPWSIEHGGCFGSQCADDYAFHYVLVPNGQLEAALRKIQEVHAKVLEGPNLNDSSFRQHVKEVATVHGNRFQKGPLVRPYLVIANHFPSHASGNEADYIRRLQNLSQAHYVEYIQAVLAPENLRWTVLGRNVDRLPVQHARADSEVLSIQDHLEGPAHLAKLNPRFRAQRFIHQIQSRIGDGGGDGRGIGWILRKADLRQGLTFRLINAMLSLRQGRVVDSYLFHGPEFAYWFLLSNTPADSIDETKMRNEMSAIIGMDEVPTSALQRAKNILCKSIYEEAEGILGYAYSQTRYRTYGGIRSVQDVIDWVHSIERHDILHEMAQLRSAEAEELWIGDSPARAELVFSRQKSKDTSLSQMLQNLSSDQQHSKATNLLDRAVQLEAGVEAETAAEASDSSQGESSLAQTASDKSKPVPNLWASMPFRNWRVSPGPAQSKKPSLKFAQYPRPERLQLNNGMEALVLCERNYPLDYFGLYLRGGRLFEDSHNCGITQLLLSSMLAAPSGEAAPNKAYAQPSLSRVVEWLGGYGEADVTADVSGLRGFVQHDYLQSALARTFQAAFLPRIPDKNIIHWVKLSLQERTKARSRDLFHRSIDLFYKTVFGVHPYGLPRFGTPDSLKKIGLEELYAWHDGWLRPSKCVFTLVTSKTKDEVKALLDKTVVPLDPKPVMSRAEILSLARFAQPKRVIEEVQTKSAAVAPNTCVFGFPVVSDGTDSARYALDVLQYALTGPGGIILNAQEAHVFSRAQSFYVPLAKAGVFFLYVESRGHSSEYIRSMISKKLSELCERGFAPGQFQRAKNFAEASFRLAMQAPLHLVYELSRYHLLYREFLTVDEYARKIHSVSEEDMKAVLNQFVDIERSTAVMINSQNAVA